MDSINGKRPEGTHADVTGTAAIERIRDVVGQTATCFFCTAVGPGGSDAARPMSVQDVDDAGTLWFLSARDSQKNREIAQEPSVRLFFQGSEHSGFLVLSGRASISRDRGRITELWKPIMKTWFTGGVDDPRISVIAVSPSSGHYWDNKHGNAVAGMKMMIGAAIGRTLDDSIEGKVTL